MKHRSLYLILLLFVVLNPYLHAQVTQEQSYMTSDGSSGIFKSGESSVNLYTGAANISVPLYTAHSRRLPISLSLHYEGKGHKVQEIAGLVGLGWRIAAGGAITRMVRGMPDESQYGYNGQMLNRTGDKLGGDVSTSTYEDLAKKVAENERDGEPDVFYSTVGGKILLKPGYGIFVENNGYEIFETGCNYHTDQSSDRWVIFDAYGNKYFFGSTAQSREVTQHYYNGRATTFVSTWYLDKVVSSDGQDVITFDYTTGASYSYSFYKKTKQQLDDCGVFGSPIETSQNAQVTIQEPVYLSGIHSNVCDITFAYKGRLDLNGAKCMTSITVKNKSGVMLNEFRLAYKYFNDANGTANAKLILDEVFMWDREGVKHPVARFEYNTAINLPPRNSPKFDHWGYYNSNPATTSLPPAADKSIDAAKMQANILTKIEWPSGMSTSYVYEPHKYLLNGVEQTGGGLRVASIKNQDMESVYETKFHYRTATGDTTSGLIYKGTFDYMYNVNVGVYNSCLKMQLWSDQTYTEIFDQFGANVAYSRVEVEHPDHGKDVYFFHDLVDYPDSIEFFRYPDLRIDNLQPFGPPFGPHTSMAFMRGKVKKKEIWKADGTLISRIENKYNPVIRDQLFAIRILRMSVVSRGSTWIGGRYKELLADCKLEYTTEKIFSNGEESDFITKYKQYTYHPTYPFLIKETVETASNGDKYVNECTYARDLLNSGDNVYTYLWRNSMVAIPVEEKLWLERDNQRKLIGATLNLYDREIVGDKATPVLKRQMKLKLSTPITDYQALTSENTYDPRFAELISYDKFDKYFNCIQQTKNGVVSSAVFDEIGGVYKLAEAQNAGADEIYFMGFEMLLPETYAQQFPSTVFLIKGHTGQAYYGAAFTPDFTPPNSKSYVISYFYKRMGKWHFSGELPYVPGMTIQPQAGLDDIRIYPQQARIVSYTYEPLVGVATETSHNGKTAWYEYDGRQRLRIMRDYEGNIAQMNEYFENIPNGDTAQWQDTYSKRCIKDVNDEYTGEEEREQKDVNPNSSTFGTTRWVYRGHTGECPVSMIYVKVDYENTIYYSTTTVSDIVLRFYRDAACTIPIEVNDLNLQYYWDDFCYGPSGNESITCNGTSATVATGAFIYYEEEIYEGGYPTGGWRTCIIDCKIVPGSGFTPVY